MNIYSKKVVNVILDVDGVLWVEGSPSLGSIEFLDNLRSEGINFCLLTNDCSISKAERHSSLTESGFKIEADKLVTAAEVTWEWLKKFSVRTIMYLGSPGVIPDINKDLIIRDYTPVDAVVVGDLFEYYDRQLLNNAAKAIISGAHLVAMQKNRLWMDGANWYVDNGFWVAGLEYTTEQKAVVTGKPSKFAYITALNRIGLAESDCSNTIFISDDIVSDLKGAKKLGLITVYFGESSDLPAWVDYSAKDIYALKHILLGDKYD